MDLTCGPNEGAQLPCGATCSYMKHFKPCFAGTSNVSAVLEFAGLKKY